MKYALREAWCVYYLYREGNGKYSDYVYVTVNPCDIVASITKCIREIMSACKHSDIHREFIEITKIEGPNER